MIEKLACPEGLCCAALFIGGFMGWASSYIKWPAVALMFKALMVGALASFIFAVPSQAQDYSRDEARTEARDLAAGLEAGVSAGATGPVTPDTVPGFVTADPDETRYHGASAGLTSDAQALSLVDDNAVAVRTSITSRPQIEAGELNTWTATGLGVEADALAIVREYGGAYGDCTTEVTGGTGQTSYRYTCTSGDTLLDYEGSCRSALSVSFETDYVYQCRELWNARDCTHEIDDSCLDLFSNPTCSGWTRKSGGQCYQTGDACGGECNDVVLEAVCSAPTPERPPHETRRGPAIDAWDTAQCAAMDAEPHCTFKAETCTGPGATRLIDGVAVTRDCWEWTRTYDCKGLGEPVDDCAPPAGCALEASTCLSRDEASGDCRAQEHTYLCTAEGTPGGAVGYCEEDVYCIDGDCETLTRPQNDEFSEAISALSMLGELEDDVTEGTLSIFPGENAHCEKAIGGLQDCCKNDGLLTDIGFGCSADDRALAERQAAGLCHYVGTHCSDRTLFGICVKKRKTFCCFSGKLARIIHEQGRRQVGWDWGDRKRPDCSGFTAALFQQLDLSQIDFSEFYDTVLADFQGPDADAVSAAITNRIVDAYACHPNC